MTCDSNNLAQVLYQDESLVELIGDVICAKKKCRGEKCVYLTSFEEINKITHQCKQCKACSHLLNVRFSDQKPCVTLFGQTALEKRQSRITKKGNSRLQCDSTSAIQNSPREKQTKLILNLFQKRQRYYLIWNNRVTLLLSLLLEHKFTFLLFSNFSPSDNTLLYSQNNAIYSLQNRNTVDFGPWSRFSSFERKGSR